MRIAKLNISIVLVLTALALVTTTSMLTGYDTKVKDHRSILEHRLGNRGGQDTVSHSEN